MDVRPTGIWLLGSFMRQTPTHHPVIVPAVIVGIVSILTAIFGLYYNAMSTISALHGAFEPMLKKGDEPYFYQAFFIMSAICVCCYAILLVCGIDLVRSRLRWSRLVSFLLLFEVVYFFAIGSLWLEPTIGLSVGAATGVATGGLMGQFIILFPLWGPLLLWWARSRQQAIDAPTSGPGESFAP
jgi:glucan phosphoethanolaminetransferase (alkaline phosphatase superfamily)